MERQVVTDTPMQLHARFSVPIPPGSYTATLAPDINSTDIASGGNDVPANPSIPARTVHIEVEGPQWAMEPSELFGAFPPANSIGPFASRLPQAVLRRKTSPWERSPLTEPELPWMALVLLADGEATYHANVDPEDAYSDGRAPASANDASTGAGGANALEVSRTVIDRAFPARSELHLLCHAREIDLESTEYGSSDYVDEDGIVSVVLSNRLPLPGVAYGVYLISLEGQHDLLRPTGGPSQAEVPFGHVFELDLALDEIPRLATASVGGVAGGGGAGSASGGGAAAAGTVQHTAMVRHNVDWPALHTVLQLAEPTFTFPVLASWTFECSDEGLDFEGYMRGVDVGLLSTVRTDAAEPDRRVPVTLPTGHTQLSYTSRSGDNHVGWYRGPFTPAKVTREANRPMTHIAEQVSKAVVEGSLDLSLSAAFEIGRLMAMSDPAFIRNIRRWARTQYATTSLKSTAHPDFAARLDDLLDARLDTLVVQSIPGSLVGAIFGGTPHQPWNPNDIDMLRTKVLPSVPIHSASRLAELVDLDGMAKGLNIDRDFLEATATGALQPTDLVAVGVEAAQTISFDELAQTSAPLAENAFESVHRLDIANRLETVQLFGALAQSGFEIEGANSSILEAIDIDDSVLAGYTPVLTEILGDSDLLAGIPVRDGVSAGDIVFGRVNFP